MSKEIEFDNEFLNYISTKIALYLKWEKYNSSLYLSPVLIFYIFIIFIPSRYLIIKKEFENFEIIL